MLHVQEKEVNGFEVGWPTLQFKFQMESCVPGLTGWNFMFSFFPLYKNYTLLFALQCPPVCKPEAIGRVIALRAKVVQKGRLI